jgi:hydrogenase maturation protease
VRRGGAPGTVYVLAPILEDDPAAAGALADSHFTEPYRALILARQLGTLPAEVHVVGVEVERTEDLEIGLTPAVARAVAVAADRALGLAAGVAA